jgi:hypothetical protein
VRGRAFACACAGLVGVLAGFAAHSQSDVADPLSCTDISTLPVQTTLDFGAAIQTGIFHNFDGNGNGCDACHTTLMGVVTASGDLDLDYLDSPAPYLNIFNVPSSEYDGQVYVVPNHPEQSLLFKKVNCDASGFGSRMPNGGAFGGLSAYQQALVYDWIAAGAPAGTTDVVYRGTFDIRGFVIDDIFRAGFE